MSQRRERPEPGQEAVERALERAARLEREVIAATSGPPMPAELRAVEAALAGSQAPARRAPVRRLWLLVAGLAAAALLLWRLAPRDEDERSHGRTPLGAGSIEILEPEDEVDAFRVLRWSTSSPAAPRFRVRVLDEESDDLLLYRDDLRAVELPLDNLDTSAWRRIRIEIERLDATGESVEHGEKRSSRRSP